MKFESLEELKSFIIWAKKQKIESIKVGEVQLQFSAINFVPSLSDGPVVEPDKDPFLAQPEYKYGEKTWTDEVQGKDEEEDPDLFWSADGK